MILVTYGGACWKKKINAILPLAVLVGNQTVDVPHWLP